MIKNKHKEHPNVTDFGKRLAKLGFSKQTIDGYTYAVGLMFSVVGVDVSQSKIVKYKEWLVSQGLKPAAVNSRLSGVNKYCEFIGKPGWKVKQVKLQQKSFVDNVISETDYESLKACLLRDGNKRWFFLVWTLAATGARISEFLQMKAEHVFKGYFDMYGKGGKMRRVYFPKTLRVEFQEYLRDEKIETGSIWKNRYGKVLTSRGVATMLKKMADKYGIDRAVMHPHGFRHFYAKQFLKRSQDIVFLADLMGHDSLDTTRIYLRKTAAEQAEEVDRIITW